MRDVIIDLGAEQGQEFPENRDPGDAVHVVVAVDGDLLFVLDGLLETTHGRFDPGHLVGSDQFGQLRPQKDAALARFGDASVDEDLGHQRRDLQRLGQWSDSVVLGLDDPLISLRPC